MRSDNQKKGMFLSIRWGRIAILLAYCLLTLSFVGVSAASFRSGATSSQKIDIAAYAVAVGSKDETSLLIDCNTDNKSITYSFWVGNEQNGVISDVKIQYSVLVQVPTSLPEGITISVDGNEGTPNADRTEFTVQSAGFLLDNASIDTNAHLLTFTANDQVITQNWNAIDISVKIIASQVD